MLVAHFGEKLDSSRALHPPLASRCFVGGIPPPCLVRAWCRITRTRVSPFPCACSSHASPCPDLPLRCVFLRSICARQCTIGSLNNFRKISPLHSGRFCDIMFTSCECGAMAQRGEIQCAESQFALQSSRLVEREKFRKAILSRESAYALPLFVFLTRLLTASPEIRTRGFFCSSAEWRALKVRQFLGAFVMNL